MLRAYSIAIYKIKWPYIKKDLVEERIFYGDYDSLQEELFKLEKDFPEDEYDIRWDVLLPFHP